MRSGFFSWAADFFENSEFRQDLHPRPCPCSGRQTAEMEIF